MTLSIAVALIGLSCCLMILPLGAMSVWLKQHQEDELSTLVSKATAVAAVGAIVCILSAPWIDTLTG